MKNLNAIELQSLLRKIGKVSVAELEYYLELTFTEAKTVRDRMIALKWIGETEESGFHAVLVNNLTLRRINSEERDGLVNDLSPDCISALECIAKHTGASVDDIELAVTGASDTLAALNIIEKHKLAHRVGAEYYLNVPKRAVDVFREIVNLRRILERRPAEKDQIEKQIKKAFDRLL